MIFVDCDPNYKPSTSTELENLVVRLERIVDRLERTVSQRDLDSSQKLLNTVLTTASTSVETVRELKVNNYLEEDNLPTVLPHLEKRINHIEEELNQETSKNLNIPTVVQQIEIKDPPKKQDKVKAMSVHAYEDIMFGPLAQFLEKSNKIGGDVATIGDFVKKAFE